MSALPGPWLADPDATCPICGERFESYAKCTHGLADAEAWFAQHEQAPSSPASASSPLPQDSAARKAVPLARGLLDYFPAACGAVAELSRQANEKHNPGEPMHHARGKSTDHADCIMRHLVDRGEFYEETLPDGTVTRMRHSTAIAWRALALLQEELEQAGAPLARGARK